MITIYKYQFKLADYFEVKMPEHARILDVQMQNGEHVMWAIVNIDLPLEKRKFYCRRTGEELNGLDLFRTHIATIQDIYVWHIFE